MKATRVCRRCGGEMKWTESIEHYYESVFGNKFYSPETFGFSSGYVCSCGYTVIEPYTWRENEAVCT